MLITAKRAAIAATLVAVTFSGCAVSKEEAGKCYLSAVCPANNTSDEWNKAADSGDFSALQDVVRKSITIEKATAAKLEDDSISWPKEVDEADIQAIADSYYGEVAGMQAIVNADDEDDADFSFLDSDKGQAESQRVRAKLGLSSDTEANCK